LSKISLKDFLDRGKITLGENIISVVCELKNGKTIEERIAITIYDSTALRIASYNSYQPFFDDKLLNIVNVKTTIPCRVHLFYRADTTAVFSVFTSTE